MAELKTRYKHIHFAERPGDKDTPYNCVNNRSGSVLGKVYFYQRWHKFVFWPSCGAIFDSSCLADIQHFLNQLKE